MHSKNDSNPDHMIQPITFLFKGPLGSGKRGEFEIKDFSEFEANFESVGYVIPASICDYFVLSKS